MKLNSLLHTQCRCRYGLFCHSVDENIICTMAYCVWYGVACEVCYVNVELIYMCVCLYVMSFNIYI